MTTPDLNHRLKETERFGCLITQKRQYAWNLPIFSSHYLERQEFRQEKLTAMLILKIRKFNPFLLLPTYFMHGRSTMIMLKRHGLRLIPRGNRLPESIILQKWI